MAEYDVLIYGAGPSGSYLGRLLSEKGIKTAIFDARQEIGVPLYSGEGASSSLILDRFRIDADKTKLSTVEDVDLYFTTPEDNLKPIKMHSSNSKDGIDCTVDRDKLDKEMASLAAISGCDLRIRKKIESVVSNRDGFRVRFSGSEASEVNARIVVRADGPESGMINDKCIVAPICSGRKYSSHDYASFIALGFSGGRYIQDLSHGDGFRTRVIEGKLDEAEDKGWITRHRMNALIIYEPFPYSEGLINIGSRAIGQDPVFLNGLNYAAMTAEMAVDPIAQGINSNDSLKAIEIYAENFKKIELKYIKNSEIWKKIRGLDRKRILELQEKMSEADFHSIDINELFFNRKSSVESLTTDFR